MGLFITTLGEYLWMLCIVALLLSLMWPSSKSAKITILIWIASNLAQDRLAPVLMKISDTDPELSRLVWYPTWVAMQIGTLAIIWYLHNKFTWPVEKVSKFICLSLLVYSLINFARFTDRIIMNTNLLGDFYKYGIPAVNIAAILAVVLWSCSGMLKYKKGHL